MLHPLAIQRQDDAEPLTGLRDQILGILREGSDQAQALAVAAIDAAGQHLSADARRYLLAPPAIPQNDWSSHTPAWIFSQGIEERFELILATMPGLIGPSEVAGVMKPMSLSAPLNERGHALLMWSMAKALARHGMPEEKFWKAINDGKPVASDEDVLEPGGQWHPDYRHMATTILNALLRSGKNISEESDKPKRKPKVNNRQPNKAGPATEDEDQLDLLTSPLR